VVVENNRILLTPNFDTHEGSVLWVLPGGRVEFGERRNDTAAREFLEETGLHATVVNFFRVTQSIRDDPPWHSITIAFTGEIVGGELRAEDHPVYGLKEPRWFSRDDLVTVAYHLKETIDLAMASL
jgi:ADP-ribose pyrophosphatase YjhB (NUDIX family)